MKHLLLLIALIASSFSSFAQVVIGNGTVDLIYRLPVSNYDNYSYSQVIYPAAVINASGTITSLKYQKSGTNVSVSDHWTIYLGHTTLSEFSSTSAWISTGAMTQVYADYVVQTGDEVEVFLTTPFVYNGTDNLVIAVDENIPAANTNGGGYYYGARSHSGKKTSLRYSGSSNPNPASPPTASARSGSWASVTIGGLNASCNPLDGLNASNLTGASATLEWNAGTGGTVEVEYGPANYTIGTGTSSFTTANTENISGLSQLSSYDFYVRDICAPGDTSAWTGPFRFETPCYAKVPTYSEDFTPYVPIPDCWIERQGVLGTINTVFEDNTAHSDWEQGEFGNVGSTNRGAQQMTIFGSSSDEWMITPSVDLGTGNTYSLEFDVALTVTYDGSPVDFGPNDTLAVVISPDNGTTWNTANILQMWTEGSEPSNIGDHISIDLSSYTGNVQFGFYGGSTGGGVTGCQVYIDNFLVHETPTCAQPTGVSISAITGWSAEIDWTQNATHTLIEYGPEGFTPGTGTIVESDSGSVELSGLSGRTDYAFYLVDSCGVGDVSLTTGPFYFTTECSFYTPTYLEEFVSSPSNWDCWTQSDGVLNPTNVTFADSPYSNWSSDGFGNVGYSGSARISTYGIINTWLFSPSIDLGNGSIPYQLEFDIAMTSGATASTTASGNFDVGDSVVLLISEDNGATWNSSGILRTWVDGQEPSNTGNHIIIDITGYTGMVQFAFYAESPVLAAKNNIYIDNFEIPSCARPNDVLVDVTSATTADVAWTQIATNTIIEYGPAGFTPGTGTTVQSTTGDATITGLLPDSDFELYIKDSCGVSSVSAWGGPYPFSTPCINYVPTYTQDFSVFFPDCWEEKQGALGVDTTTFTDHTASSWAEDGFGNVGWTESARMNIIGSGQDEWMISPTIDLGTGSTTYQVEFDVALTEYGSTNGDWMDADDSLVFVISTDNGITWSQDHMLKIWTFGDEPSNTGDYVLIELGAYTGLVRFGFYAASSIADGNYNVYIDNFVVQEVPSCQQPLDLGLDSIFTTTAHISWTQGALDAILEYGAPGFTPGTGAGTIIQSTDGTAEMTSLLANTAYDVYVMDSCGVGDVSLWSGPLPIQTECDVIIPDHLEDFTTYLPDCWSQFSGELFANSVAVSNPYTSLWTVDGFGNVTSTGAARINIYSPASTNNDRFEWLVSPSIDLGNGAIDYLLEFDIALTQYLSNSATTFDSDDQFKVVISTDDGATWSSSNVLQTWEAGSEPSTTGDHINISLLGYTGVVKIGFYGETIGTGGNVNVYIDNFEILTCTPSAGALTTTECDTYTAPSGAIHTNTAIFNDTIINAMGCDSIVAIDLTILQGSTHSITNVGCGAYVSDAGNSYTATGIYTETFLNAVGCDSVLTLDLDITMTDLTVTQTSGVELESNETNPSAEFQWLDCNDSHSEISGETNELYVATVNGSYAVEITKGSCVDTTACLTVNSVGVEATQDQPTSIYPTITNDHITIEIPSSLVGEEIQVVNALGEIVMNKTLNDQRSIVEVNELTSGVYFIYVGKVAFKVVVTE